MRNQGVVENKWVLLKGVSGSFRPGVLTALMGVTGAGKKTLMDVLAGRKIGGYVGGNITISGYQKKQETFARISGYCKQNDIHSPHVPSFSSPVKMKFHRMGRKAQIESVLDYIHPQMEEVMVELGLYTPSTEVVLGCTQHFDSSQH
ncbi:ABC transporter G family member 32 [Vigna angularis]|uniref:ABC transporter G family member 32 n=1 Tax=Phaseolus angularis TaxID=3914 RepID=A0A8T0L232_PHAAN|nr:ABC transporter G family member 32 [Vigna angularis]